MKQITWGKTPRKAALPPSHFGMVDRKMTYKIMAYNDRDQQLRYRLTSYEGKLIREDFRSADGAKAHALEHANGG